MPGLRERKKQQTREKIARAALRLFARRGFEATTIAGIAEAADISPRTFFSYFDTKEAVVFHDFDEQLEKLRAHFEERPGGTTTFEALRDWVEDWIGSRDVSREELARRKLVRETPALQAYERAHLGRFENLIAESVARDLGVGADELRPRMISAAAVAALVSLGEREEDEVAEDPMSVVEEAVAFLEGGLSALKRRR